ncbi:MAG: DNA-directed RNA polymerase, partial [Candidatus Micrarchaeia archaeon]
LKEVEDRIEVPASMFGSNLEDAVVNLLRTKFERRIYRDVGIILSILDAEISGEGIVLPGDPGAYYNVKFEALTFIPQVNEVFEADVTEIVEFGAFASIGPLQGLLHVSQIGSDKFFYDKKAKTLGAKSEKKVVKKGDALLVKVSTVSIKSTFTDTKIGLTMRPDGLGKAEWMEEKKKVAAPKKEGKKEKEGDKK